MIVLLPLLIPLAAAALMVALGRGAKLHRSLAFVASGGQLAASLFLLVQVWQNGPASVNMGGWPAPYGIVLVADTLAAVMVVATGLLGLLGVWSAATTVEHEVQRLFFFPVLMTLLAGVAGSFLTGDLFNLFVWFEVILMSSFVLMSLGRGAKQTPAALRYMALNLIGSALFLSACGLIYGAAGTLNLAHLSQRIGQVPPGLATALAILLLCAFLIKAASFPLFGWLPSSYPTVPVALAAVMAGLLTKVGVYAIFRVFTLVFPSSEGLLGGILAFAALGSMVVGVIGAYGQDEYRRILTFHIISQIGYMLAGVAMGGVLALAGGIFITLLNMAAKTGLFYLSGAAEAQFGQKPLKEMGGLRKSRPWSARLFLVCGLGLAGIPPLGGFFAKLSLVQAAGALEKWIFMAVMLAVSLVTLLSMTKIWLEAYVKEAPEEPLPVRSHTPWLGPAAVLALAVILMGVYAGPLQDACLRIGQELVEPSGYIRASLREGAP